MLKYNDDIYTFLVVLSILLIILTFYTFNKINNVYAPEDDRKFKDSNY